MKEEFLFNLKISAKNSYELLNLKELRERGEKFSLVLDAMFEAMINNEKRKKFGAYLIALSFDLEYKEVIKSIRIEKEKLDKDRVLEAKRTVDFVCSINDEYYSIEMNNCPAPDSLIRNIYYAVDISKSKMKMGTGYDYKKVMQINLCNFTFLGHNEIMEEYIKEANKASIDDEVVGAYDKELDDRLKRETLNIYEQKIAREKGLEEGRKEGKKEEQIEIVKNMIAKDFDFKIISEITNLKVEEIENLK